MHRVSFLPLVYVLRNIRILAPAGLQLHKYATCSFFKKAKGSVLLAISRLQITGN
jgi:hypothetical protein